MNVRTVLRRAGKRVAVLGATAGVAAIALTGCSSSGSAQGAQQSSPSVAPASSSVAPASSSADAAQLSGNRPTVVLVHGAFVGSNEWTGEIQRLQVAGYPVVAPPVPLRGLASDTTYLQSFLKSVKGPVILVAHSISGMTITQAAVGNPQVKALVYIAALIPNVGETTTELVGKYPGATLGTALNQVPTGGGNADLYVQPAKYHAVYGADLPTSLTSVLAAEQSPVAASMFGEKATVAAWKTIPSWDLITTQDQAATLKVQLFMAHRAHAHITEVAASHAVAISQPAAVTTIIEQAAKATVG